MTKRIHVREVAATGYDGAGLKALHDDGSWKVPGGSSLTVQDENANVTTGVTQLDFQGGAITATSGTGEVVVTVPIRVILLDAGQTVAQYLTANGLSALPAGTLIARKA